MRRAGVVLRVHGRAAGGVPLPVRARGALLRVCGDAGQGCAGQDAQLAGQHVPDLSQAHKKHRPHVLPVMTGHTIDDR